jgi:flagellar biosynthesis protein FlhF
MKIRRYIGKDVQEAMIKVKMELGNEAVVLNTKKIRQKGLLNFFKKPLIEVLVAVDETSKIQPAKNTKPLQNMEKNTCEEKKQKASEKDGKIVELENKVNKMEDLIQKVYDEIKSSGQKVEDKIPVKETTNSRLKKLLYSNLLKNEIEPEIVNKIMNVVSEKMGSAANMNEAAATVFSLIADMLGAPETLKIREEGKPTVVLFIGPTGVGKTTTLAKIAANYSLNHKKKVGLITADTYRIAAVEQLKTYADILGLPVSVVYSSIEIKAAIEKYKDKDIVLIDTAGRSIKEKEQFDELKKLVEAAVADEVYLVLSSTTSMSNCKQIIDTYNFLENYKLIFTKLDETSVIGVVLNARHYTNKSLSYITTGQSVPDDIEVVDTGKLTKNLLGSLQK